MKYITPAPKFYYYIDDKDEKKNLKDALSSYISNCTNLKKGSDIKQINSRDYFFAVHDEENFTSLLSFIYDNSIKSSQVRLCGFGNCYDINLCEIQSLKFQITNSTNKIQGEKARHIKIVENTLVTLFKGHGDNSLLSYIGKSYSFINNYNILHRNPSDNLKLSDLYHHFLKPGLNNISVFSAKINEYAKYLYFSGWERELSDINKIIRDINIKDIENEVSCNSGKFKGDKLLKNISKVERIIKKINNEFNIIKDEASDFNCR